MNVINRIIYKIVKEVRKWWYRSHSTLVPKGSWRDVQPVCFLGKGKVCMGENNVFGFFPSPYFFTGYCHVEARCSDAVIRIGSNNYFNNNIEISADHGEISIGSNCLVGTNVSIMNSDFHSISTANRHTGGA